MSTHSKATTLVLVLVLALAALPALAGGAGPAENDNGCAGQAPADGYKIYLPIVGRGEGGMSESSASAKIAAARQRLTQVLGTRFQGKINYRTGVVSAVTYDDNGRVKAVLAMVDGVAAPVRVPPGIALSLGDSIEVVNRGGPSAPDYVYSLHTSSSYGMAVVSPTATLTTPTGLSLQALLRRPTTGGQVAAILASWSSLSDMVMQGGRYELAIRRNEEETEHVSSCPHVLGSTTTDASTTAGDTTITVVSTASLPNAGSVKLADAVIAYTGKTSVTLTGASWTGGSGSYGVGTGVFGLTQVFLFDHLLTGTDYSIKIKAVSASGATSAWSSWASITTGGNKQLQILDRFDTYARTDLSNLESLSALQLDDFENTSGWAVSGYGTKANDTTHVKEGGNALKGTVQQTSPPNPYYAVYLQKTVAWDLSVEGRFTSGDYVCVWVYVSDANPANGQVEVYFATSLGVNYYKWISGLASGWNRIIIKKNSFLADPGADWSNITIAGFGYMTLNDAAAYAVFDDLCIMKADPLDSTTYNPTGGLWAFVPAIRSGSDWEVVAGNKTGEPARPYGLAQLYTAASPTNWLLAYHTLSDLYYSTLTSGFWLKGVDGQAALFFCIQDATVAGRTAYAVELNTATNQVLLVKWVAGVRTVIATKAFTSAPNQIVQLGVDFRDLEIEGEGRIKVYATLTAGDVFLASNMVISTTDTAIERGGYVGVGFKEANGRVVDVRGGSPQYADSAGHAFHAELAERALLADVATTANAVDLNGVADTLILDADGDTGIDADTDDQIDVKVGGTDKLSITSTLLTSQIAIAQAAGADVFPNADGLGLAKLLINPAGLTDWDAHFRTGETSGPGNGSLVNYSWVNDATFGGTPSSVYYDRYGEFFQAATNSAAKKYFMARAITNAAANWQNKRIYGMLGVGAVTEFGFRVDGGNDNSFCELYLTGAASNGTYTLTIRHRAGGGAVTTTASGVIKPVDAFTIVMLRCYYSAPNYSFIGYIVDPTSGAANVSLGTGTIAWAPAAGQAGFLLNAVGNYGTCHWFKNEFV